MSFLIDLTPRGVYLAFGRTLSNSRPNNRARWQGRREVVISIYFALTLWTTSERDLNRIREPQKGHLTAPDSILLNVLLQLPHRYIQSPSFVFSCGTYLSLFCRECRRHVCRTGKLYPAMAALPDGGGQASDFFCTAARTFLRCSKFAFDLDDQLARFRAVSRAEPSSKPNFFCPSHKTTRHVCGFRRLG